MNKRTEEAQLSKQKEKGKKGKSSRATADSSWAKSNLPHDIAMSAKVYSDSIQGISAAQILQHRSA